ncbi:reverse transcriptase domain-containing protein [Escherichia coli]|uniref:reverse transcriptase domain-containing protein n=1 Tax=Escherichia coli TaxID=562 RepID=UPI002574B1B5|nr:reverse transcriptase domain-containing protein [Escherichia coli]MDM1593467.1 hypothetical protein [Escherichia coli]
MVFDELASWYKDKVDVMVDDIDADVHVNLPNEVSTSLSGPAGSSSDTSNVSPWSGRLRHESASTSTNVLDKGKKKVEGIGVTGYESSSSKSLDEELGIPVIRTPGVDRHERYVPPHARRVHSEPQAVRRSQRVRYPVERLTYKGYAMHYAYMMSMVKHVEPSCFDEAIGKHVWEKAMDEEMDALVRNDTWEWVSLPSEKNAIGYKWVYKVKCNSDGSIERHKARLVAKGYAQIEG